jgi:hypothetical protein
MDTKQHQRNPDILENKYKKLKYNFCCYSFFGGIAANGSTILSQKVDSGTEFYPRELRGHAWVQGNLATPGYFQITNIQLGLSRNSLYGAGIFSDILSKENAIPWNFSAYIAPARDIQFNITEMNGANIFVALYLIGEAKYI